MASQDELTVAVTGPTGTFGFGLMPLLGAAKGGPTLANFASMDLNHDGTVTPAEANAPEKTASAPAKKPTFKNTPAITR